MIVSYYTEIDKLWTNEELENRLLQLPLSVRHNILQYGQSHDRQLHIFGKLLLMKMLQDFYPNRPDLSDGLQYDHDGRPFLPDGFDFNIAHSGNIAICAITNKGNIGVDVEIVKDIDLNLFKEYFTSVEWDMINNSGNPLEQFYTMWVRKEAVIKAIGKGIHQPLISIDVCNDIVNYKNYTFYLHNINLHPLYKATIANTEKDMGIFIKKLII